MHYYFVTAHQPHSTDIFLNQKILPWNKLINQHEGIVASKVIIGMYTCLATFLLTDITNLETMKI